MTIVCPSCSARISAPDKLAGKTATCPKCRSAFSLPGPVSAGDSGFEVVEDDEPVVARPKKKPPAVDPGFEVVEDDEPVVATPRKHSGKVVRDGGARPRPRFRRDEFDGEDSDLDERPIRRRKAGRKNAGVSPLLPLAIGGGLLLVVGLVVGLVLAFGGKGGDFWVRIG